MSMDVKAKRVPFRHRAAREQIEQAIAERIEQQANRLRSKVIPDGNRQRLKHGRHWQTHFADQPGRIQEIEEHSTEMMLPLQRIIDHDLSLLDEILVEVPRKMHGQFMHGMYQMMETTTAETGNVVSGKAFPEAFADMLNRISFGVDEWGVPTLPELHVSPHMASEIERFIAEPDPRYSEQIKELTEARQMEAIAREAERISRYRLR